MTRSKLLISLATPLLLLTTSLISCSSGNNATDRNASDSSNALSDDQLSNDTISVAADDPEMEEASATARRTLHTFDTAWLSNNQDYRNFALKVRYATPNGGEHIWCWCYDIHDHGYTGIVDNEPVWASGIHEGDTVEIAPSDISDWDYVDKGILRGGYTVRILRNRLSLEERAIFDSKSNYRFE